MKITLEVNWRPWDYFAPKKSLRRFILLMDWKVSFTFSEATWKRLPIKNDWRKVFLKKRRSFDFHTRFHHFEQQQDITFSYYKGMNPIVVLGRFFTDWVKVANGPRGPRRIFPDIRPGYLFCWCNTLTFRKCPDCGDHICRKCEGEHVSAGCCFWLEE